MAAMVSFSTETDSQGAAEGVQPADELDVLRASAFHVRKATFFLGQREAPKRPFALNFRCLTKHLTHVACETSPKDKTSHRYR